MHSNQNMSLVLSTDTKPRLKWTPQLHQSFVDAINQLGGADEATPKSLMRLMGIPGLTLYHLKSHLQKYRLGKDLLLLQPQNLSDHKQDYKEIHGIVNDGHCSDETQSQMNESLKIVQALQLQSKLHEQIEVQRHLQLRIEAQGKYLQTVLKKAQETLAGYNSSSSTTTTTTTTTTTSGKSVEFAKAELSVVNSGCPSSPFSELTTDLGGVSSSLTSSECSGRQPKNDHKIQKPNTTSVELPLMDVKPTNNLAGGKKRYFSYDDDYFEQPIPKRSTISNNNLRNAGMLDLNIQYKNGKGINLNYKGI